MGHDSINSWVCIKARCERNGEPNECSECGGTGEKWDSDRDKERAESWEPTEPPSGAGYQIWETVSEGSPVSPAFENPENLARWMVENDTSITSDSTFDDWMRFIDAGWAPSMIGGANGVSSGVRRS